jgi:NAD/NADP transhydrogenase alpha subunit
MGRTSRSDYTIEDTNLQINGDTGSNYTWKRMYSNPSVPTGGTATTAASTSATYMNSVGILGTAASSTNMVGGAIIDILDYTNTNKYKTVKSITGTDLNQEANGTSVSGFSEISSGNWMNTAAVTSLTFTTTTGTNLIAPTHIALYGIKG